MSKKVLVVDDSVYMRMQIVSALTKEGYEIVGEAANGESAIELAIEYKPDLITLDNILPDIMGFEVIKILKEEGIDSKVIMVSAVGQQTAINKGLQLGAIDYVVKPFTSETLINAVNKACMVN